MSTMQIFNARSQQVEDAEMSVDANNEIVATFQDGGFIKFPAGLTKDEFDALIVKHEEDNKGQEIITPEMEAEKVAERAASLELIGETETPTEEATDVTTAAEDANLAAESQQPDNTMSSGDTTNVPADQPAQ